MNVCLVPHDYSLIYLVCKIEFRRKMTKPTMNPFNGGFSLELLYGVFVRYKVSGVFGLFYSILFSIYHLLICFLCLTLRLK